ncbi:MAG: toprim domain-containing protein [Gammaproteobacteria bacterium]|nr:toprim domain-containing protein [Gammaproteobacteria bacterium]MBU1655148.1 toprim domain-containing protein [Gammaproteobacteria bacterium]MBU1959959.1 toprim domain-containing protein [Gammaproteobacteria bacterium]
MRQAYATSEQVRDAAVGRWLDIFHAVSPSLHPAVDAVMSGSRRHVPCPVHSSPDGFRFFGDVNKTGMGICSTCGTRQGIALIQWAEGLDYLYAKDLVAEQVGLLPDNRYVPLLPTEPRLVPPPAPSLTRDEANKRRVRIQRILRTSLAVDAPEAEPLRRYLATRGLSTKSLDPKQFRYHPGLPYYSEEGEKVGVFPALLAVMRNLDGIGVTLHRAYLTPEGEKLDRKVCTYDELAYSLSGCAVPLTRPGRVLSVGEGVETMLSVMMATRMPCWAATSTSLLANLELPDEVLEVWIWADKDRSEAGEKAAISLCERAWASGKKARIILPPGEIPYGQKSLDWNDVWVTSRKSGFPVVDPVVRLAA